MDEIELWDPFKQYRNIQKRLFDEAFPLKSSIREPLVDVSDEGKSIKVTAELPGIDRKEIDIQVDKGSISIKALLKNTLEEKRKGYYHKERSYESFFRLVPFPSEVKPETAKANYLNGILEVLIEKVKPTDSTSKKIKVKVE